MVGIGLARFRQLADGDEAVSYTHLDVYKRQLYYLYMMLSQPFCGSDRRNLHTHQLGFLI